MKDKRDRKKVFFQNQFDDPFLRLEMIFELFFLEGNPGPSDQECWGSVKVKVGAPSTGKHSSTLFFDGTLN